MPRGIFHLFRIKVERSAQQSLFGFDTNPELLRKAIEEKPTSMSRGSAEWHIGNIEELDNGWFAYALGRLTKATIGNFDRDTCNFTNENLETSLYTYVLMHINTGICGIMVKTNLAPRIEGLARRLADILTNAKVTNANNAIIQIPPINDPKSFLAELAKSVRISKYTFTFSPPNPIDKDELYQKPLENLLAASNGKKGRTTIEASPADDKGLNSEELIPLTRAVASTGNTASARLCPKGEHQEVTRHLEGDTASFSYEIPADKTPDFLGMRDIMAETYSEIRGQND